MYVCMYDAHMHVCMYVRMYVRMYLCISVVLVNYKLKPLLAAHY